MNTDFLIPKVQGNLCSSHCVFIRVNLWLTRIGMSQWFERPRAPERIGAFPHAKRVGDLLFLSGI
jgi:hypothetical protein